MKKLSFIFFLLFVQYGFAQNQIDRVAAIVGQEVILVSDIEAQYKMADAAKKNDKARCIIFDQLLANSLILAEAERDSVVISESEVETQLDSRIREILRYMNNDPEKFKQYYGMTPEEVKDEMREDMKKQLLVQKMTNKIMQDISITPKDVKDFFSRIPKDSLPYFNSEVELLELVVKPKVNAFEDQRAREKAENLRKMVMDGADFAEVALRNSDDKGTAQQGGDLGITSRGSFVAEFEAAAYQLEKLEISQVVKSEFGYHIIQLLDRLGNNIKTRHILVKAEIKPEDLILARKAIDSIRNLIMVDSFSFEQAVQKFSEEEFSKTRAGMMTNNATGETHWELGQLDPEVYFAIEKLKIGEISKSIEFSSPFGESIFKIIKLRNKTLPHVANLKDDYSRIQQAAIEEKKSKYIKEWIDKRIPKNYVEFKINELGDYSNFLLNKDGTVNCPMLGRWMVKP